MLQKYIAFDTETGEIKPFKNKPKISRPRSLSQDLKKQLAKYLIKGTTADVWSFEGLADVDVESIELIHKFANSTQADISFLSKLIVYSRKNSYCYEIVLLSLLILSASRVQFAKDKFKEIFKDVILTFDDMADFVDIINSKAIRGYGKIIRFAIGQWILNLPPHMAARYKTISRKNNVINGVSKNRINLIDLINLSHPKPVDNEQSMVLQWLIKNELSTNISPVYKKYDQSNPRAWINLFNSLPIEETTQDIRAFYRKKVFDNKLCLKRASTIFTNVNLIKQSGLYPHTFTDAFDQVSNGPTKLLSALEEAAELSLMNVPDIKGEIAIFVDQSYYMDEIQLNPDVMSTARMAISTIAAVMAKKADSSYVIPYSKNATLMTIDKNKSIISIANKISTPNIGVIVKKADYAGLFKYLDSLSITPSKMVFITAGQEWTDILRSSSELNNSFSHYLSTINTATPRMLFWNVNSKIDKRFRHSLPNSSFLFGWANSRIKYAFDFLSELDLTKLVGQLDTI